MQPAYPNSPEPKSENSAPSRNLRRETRQTLNLTGEAFLPLTSAGRDGEKTFREIGCALGISGVRARELYLKGMNKLRRELVGA